MTAYLLLLSKWYSRLNFQVYMVDFMIFNGSYAFPNQIPLTFVSARVKNDDIYPLQRVIVNGLNKMKLNKAAILIFQQFQDYLVTYHLLLGTYHKDNCHWMLVIVDLKQQIFLFVDPLGTNEVTNGQLYIENICRWACHYSAAMHNTDIPTQYRLGTVQHALEVYSQNWGVYTLWVCIFMMDMKSYSYDHFYHSECHN